MQAHIVRAANLNKSDFERFVGSLDPEKGTDADTLDFAEMD